MLLGISIYFYIYRPGSDTRCLPAYRQQKVYAVMFHLRWGVISPLKHNLDQMPLMTTFLSIKLALFACSDSVEASDFLSLFGGDSVAAFKAFSVFDTNNTGKVTKEEVSRDMRTQIMLIQNILQHDYSWSST